MIYIIYLCYTILITIIVFWPELMPKCSHCGKIKPRFKIEMHKAINLSLGYKGNSSICKRCFTTEDITSFGKVRHRKNIEERVKYKTKYMKF